jgi:Bax protein
MRKRVFIATIFLGASLNGLFCKDFITKKEIKKYVNSLGFPKWYYDIKDIKKAKESFVELLLPLIKKENQKIYNERITAINIFKKGYFSWSNQEKTTIIKLAKKYKIRDIFNQQEYKKRIDKIPISLVLAQAAIESGWGKSRFVKDANNIFGHWTFSEIGIVPLKRDENKKHKLKLFRNLSESIATYMLNLNRNRAYKEFRKERFLCKLENKTFNGMIAAKNLKRYSAIGIEYVYRLKRVIRVNNLNRYDSEMG